MNKGLDNLTLHTRQNAKVPSTCRSRPDFAGIATSHRHISRWHLVTVLLWLLCTLPVPGLASPLQSLEQIREAARNYAQGLTQAEATQVRVEAGQLDPRLRLAACDRPLETFLPPGSRRLGAITVGVRCNGASRWSLYVPVTIHVYGNIVVAARPLPRGVILQAGDLKTERHDLSRVPPGYLVRVADAVGMVLLRPLAPGNTLSESALKPRQLVRRGERVTIVAELSGLVVRSAGTALMNGAYGQVIQVRNLRSKRVVDAVVSAPGIVKIRM